jgi:hypothetical protein
LGARDALSLREAGGWTDWTVAGTLYQIEGYNGWGYRLYHSHVLSPYVWSFSTHYASGKYVADGRWSDTEISQQCGSAELLRRMAEMGAVHFSDQPPPSPGGAPLVVSHSMRRSDDEAVASRAEELQRWLNTFPGVFVKEDGIPGDLTSEAYQRVTGKYLPGDARG